MHIKYLIIALALTASISSVAAIEINPPLTRDEQRSLVEVRKQWKDSGMPPMTADQEVAMMQSLRDTQIRLMGQTMAMEQAIKSGEWQRRLTEAYSQSQREGMQQAPQQADSRAEMSREELAALYEERAAGEKFTRFERSGDGFLANGRVFIDVDGSVSQFGADSTTGRVTYFVDIGNGEQLVKHHNVNSDLDPIRVGKIIQRGDRFDFSSVSGETAGGQSVAPVSDGVLVARNESIARYRIGQGARAFPVPDGFNVAPLQAGDIAGTGYLLVERSGTSQASLQSVGSAVGSLFGKKDKTQDYALMHIETGRVVPLFMSLRGNSVGQGENCVRQNAAVNRCSDWRSWDSVWEPDGRPNHSHYFWSLTWIQSKFGPIAVAKENNTSEINIIKLETGERFNAFTRSLGIVSFATEQLEDGGVALDARLAFRTHRIDDLGKVFDGSWAAGQAAD